MTDPRDLIQQLADAYAYCIDKYMTAPSDEDALIQEARAYLSQPSSLRERAIAALNEIEDRTLGPTNQEILIRRALEQLDD